MEEKKAQNAVAREGEREERFFAYPKKHIFIPRSKADTIIRSTAGSMHIRTWFNHTSASGGAEGGAQLYYYLFCDAIVRTSI